MEKFYGIYKMKPYTLPPINLWNFWIYNKFIREYDDKTIYKEWIDAKIEEYYQQFNRG